MNNSSNGIEERLKFYLSKQIGILEKVIGLWLKSDKMSNRFVEFIFSKFNEVSMVNSENYCHMENSGGSG